MVVQKVQAQCARPVDYFHEHRETIGFGLRVTTLGHVVRGGTPTAADRARNPSRGGSRGATRPWRQRCIDGDALQFHRGDAARGDRRKTKPMSRDLLDLARVLARSNCRARAGTVSRTRLAGGDHGRSEPSTYSRWMLLRRRRASPTIRTTPMSARASTAMKGRQGSVIRCSSAAMVRAPCGISCRTISCRAWSRRSPSPHGNSWQK